MRVLHVITGLGDGGAEAVLYRLVCHDPADEHHVIALISEGKYAPLLRDAGAHVTTLDMPRGRVTFKGLWRMWRTLRTAQADVVQSWMYHADLLGGVLARLAGVPVVWGIHNTTLEAERSSRSTLWVARLCAALSRFVPQRIVACAQAAVTVHAALGYDAQRMVVIANGYDLARFSPDATARVRLRTEWNLEEGVPLLGLVARFDPYKDHANLIAALALLQAPGLQFQAVLVGQDVDAANAKLVAQISAAGLEPRVRLLGPRSDVPAVMAALDVHVLPSMAEAFPNVLAEAMACGTPCVCTDVGDAALIVGDTGWVVPPHNPAALADALGCALQHWRDTPHWQQRQQRVRQRIEQAFDIVRMVRGYRQVWQGVCFNGQN